MLMKTKKYRYTGKDFDIKTAPTKVKDSADDLKKIKKKIRKNVKSIKNAMKYYLENNNNIDDEKLKLIKEILKASELPNLKKHL